jgi:hypothetical protein
MNDSQKEKAFMFCRIKKYIYILMIGCQLVFAFDNIFRTSLTISPNKVVVNNLRSSGIL